MSLCKACSASRSTEYCYCSPMYESDRHDAELMLQAMRIRKQHVGRIVHWSTYVDDEGVECCGYVWFGGAVLSASQYLVNGREIWRDIRYFE